MKILYVAYSVPVVPSTGGLTRAYHLVRAAVDLGDVTVLGVVEPSVTPDCSALSGHCRIEIAPAPRARSRLPRALRRLIFPGSAVQWRFNAQPLMNAACRLLDGVDLVVAEHAEIASALRPVIRGWGGPAVADLHNVLSAHEIRVRQLDGDGGLQARRAVAALRRMERGILRDFQCVSAVSAVDAAQLRALRPEAVEVIPNGVDVSYFDLPEPRKEDRLVFTGALWYRPNVDGLRHFLDRVWPLLRRARPGVRLDIVGARPSAEVRAMGEDEGVAVHADVPDVRPYLQRASVAIVPLRLGTGTRLKILEALAAGRPVVSTAVGAEGLELEPGRDLLVADEPEAQVEAIARLLACPKEARRFAAQGRATVRQRYDWPVISRRFQRLLETTHSK